MRDEAGQLVSTPDAATLEGKRDRAPRLALLDVLHEVSK
jgi:hypothetical protein